MDGYQLFFDRVDKTYITKNRKLIIRPRLNKAMRKEELSSTELATTDFVLRTGNATMVFLEELRVLRQPFHREAYEELKVFCDQPIRKIDEIYKNRRKFLMALRDKLGKENRVQRNGKRAQRRYQTLDDAMGGNTTLVERRNGS